MKGSQCNLNRYPLITLALETLQWGYKLGTRPLNSEILTRGEVIIKKTTTKFSQRINENKVNVCPHVPTLVYC